MNILRNIILFGWMAIACTAFAQDRNADKVERPNTKKINFGIKAGFNSSMFMVSELKIKDVTIDEVRTVPKHNRVRWQGVANRVCQR